MAAEQGFSNAQVGLGHMYANHFPRDEAEAVRWYRLGAEQGHDGAQRYLGDMYGQGRGVLKDAVLAHMWWNIAGANGNGTARESRDSLERDMSRAEITRATELARTCMASDYQDCGRYKATGRERCLVCRLDPRRRNPNEDTSNTRRPCPFRAGLDADRGLLAQVVSRGPGPHRTPETG